MNNAQPITTSSQQPQNRNNYQFVRIKEVISKTKATLAAMRLLLLPRQVPPWRGKEPPPTPPPHRGMSRFCYDVLVGKNGGFSRVGLKWWVLWAISILLYGGWVKLQWEILGVSSE